MSIPINKIINVDFKIVQQTQIIGSYKTVVYIIPDKFKVNSVEQKAVICNRYEVVNNTLKFYTVESKEITDLSIEIQHNIKQYFKNGGVRLLLLTPSAYTENAFVSDLEEARKLSNDFIYIVINNSICDVSDASKGYTSSNLLSIVKYVEQLRAPYTARILLTKNIKEVSGGTTTFDYDYINTFKDYSVGVKFCSKTINSKVVDAALLIGAYFAKINLNNYQTIKDYCYTEEIIVDNNNKDITEEGVTSEQYDNLIENNYNFIDKTANYVVNFGGNLANGVSLHTDFGTICVENDICFATLDTLLGKQYLNESGLTNIVATINSQLQRYKSNGYLYTNTLYSGENLSIEYNGSSYNVINKGTSLPQGFYIFTIPISQISAEDKLSRKFTPIYVVMETLYGARTVTIQGEVR